MLKVDPYFVSPSHDPFAYKACQGAQPGLDMRAVDLPVDDAVHKPHSSTRPWLPPQLILPPFQADRLVAVLDSGRTRHRPGQRIGRWVGEAAAHGSRSGSRAPGKADFQAGRHLRARVRIVDPALLQARLDPGSTMCATSPWRSKSVGCRQACDTPPRRLWWCSGCKLAKTRGASRTASPEQLWQEMILTAPRHAFEPIGTSASATEYAFCIFRGRNIASATMDPHLQLRWSKI